MKSRHSTPVNTSDLVVWLGLLFHYFFFPNKLFNFLNKYLRWKRGVQQHFTHDVIQTRICCGFIINPAHAPRCARCFSRLGAKETLPRNSQAGNSVAKRNNCLQLCRVNQVIKLCWWFLSNSGPIRDAGGRSRDWASEAACTPGMYTLKFDWNLLVYSSSMYIPK